MAITPTNVTDPLTPEQFGYAANTTPNAVSAYSALPSSLTATAPNPVSSTSGVRSQFNTLSNSINSVDVGLPTLSPPPSLPTFGQYNPDQQARIDRAGGSIGSEYDSLIRRAEEEKRQGMAKNIVAAGQRGGFMNSQFSGIAATTPTVGGNFVGAGGQLERIKSQYDLNIQDLQVKKIGAIEAAKEAMRKYTDTGKQQDFENARASYQDAVSAQEKQARAVSDAQKALVDAQKAEFDLSVPLSQAGEDIQKYAIDQITKYPGVINDFLAKGGTMADFNNLTANDLTALLANNKDFIMDQAKGNTEVVKLDNGNTVLIDKNTGNIIKSLGGVQSSGFSIGGGGGANGADYAGVINTILGSGKFTKDQARSIANAINKGEDPFTVVKNQAKQIMSNSMADDLSKLETARSSMESLNSLLTEYYANGGTTGFFKGNIEQVANKLGQVKDKKLVGIATRIATTIQKYRHAVSGTAYSAQEGQQIDSVFPGIRNSEGLNEAIIGSRLAAFDDDIDSGYRTFLGSAYDRLKSAELKKQENTAGATITLPDGTKHSAGDVVTNSKGQKGRVNADGTITPL